MTTAYKPGTGPWAVCPSCNERFQLRTVGQVYCSRACFATSLRKPDPAWCEMCGKQFERNFSNRGQRFHNKKCAGAFRKATRGKLVTRSCNQCRKPFLPATPRYGDNLCAACLDKERLITAHPLRSTWANMWQRCTNPRANSWPHYGGRGIQVCDEWKDFAIFVRDVGERPLGHTLDRIDNDGPYAPWNVRWATRVEQMKNSRPKRSGRNQRGQFKAAG